MVRAVQIGIVVCCLAKYTFALLSCPNYNSISICSDGRRQGGHVYVDFSLSPLYEINVSCSCFIFAQSDTEILAGYETSSASDIILNNTSIRLGDQTFLEATKSFIQLSANSFKKLHFSGDIGTQPPEVCLKFNSSLKINIEVVCLPNNNTTVPISGFAKQTITTEKQPTSGTSEQSTSSTAKQSTASTAGQPTSSTPEQSTSNTAEQTTSGAAGQPTSDTAELSQHGDQPGRINYIIIGGAVGGGIGIVVVVVIVVAVVICRRRRLSTRAIKKQTTTDTTDSKRDNDKIHNYVNTLQISAGEHNQTSENPNYEVLSSNRCEAIYDQPILNITSGV